MTNDDKVTFSINSFENLEEGLDRLSDKVSNFSSVLDQILGNLENLKALRVDTLGTEKGE